MYNNNNTNQPNPIMNSPAIGMNQLNVNNRVLMQQQQAQLLFRQQQRQQQVQVQMQQQAHLMSQQQSNTLPPTPTLSSQGSPANHFSQVVTAGAAMQQQIGKQPILTSTTTTTSSAIANNGILPPSTPQSQGVGIVPTPQLQPRNTAAQAQPSMGQAVLRLLQFRDQLSPGDQAQDVNFWNSFVDDFFTTTATMKLGLLDNIQQENLEFDITSSLIPRFFHTHYQCDLKSIQLTTDQTMEYFLPTGMMLECPRSSLVHRYNNGTLVILSGELSVLFNMDPNDGILKIHKWKFMCNHHDEFIARSKLVASESSATATSTNTTGNKKKSAKAIAAAQAAQAAAAAKGPTFHAPTSLVNSWGVPERMFQLLKITDASVRFGEVAFFSLVTGLNPQDALTAMSFAISQQMSYAYPEEQRPTQQLSQQQQTQLPTQQQMQLAQHQQQQIASRQQQEQQQHQLQLQLAQQQQHHMLLQQQQQHQNTQQQMIKMEEDILSSPLLNNVDIMAVTQQSPFMNNNIPPSQQQQQQGSTTPFLNNNTVLPPPPTTPNPNQQQNAQLLQQQRYYQQQNLRIQQQQQALQLQQRQAMQRLQQPFTTSTASNPSIKTEPSSAIASVAQVGATGGSVENVNGGASDTKPAPTRKRKMSIQKDGATPTKKQTGKKGKKAQQQAQTQK